MYKQHNLFDSPPSDAELWRYLDFTRFVSLLDKQAIFFPRADKLGDPFEGSYTKFNVAIRPTIYKDKIPDHALQQMSDFVRESRRFTLISCWHLNDHESAAMWKLYSRESDGIAVKTTFGSFTQSLKADEDIFVGKVNYIDYENTFIREDNLFAPFLYKRKSFEHEREVRAISQKFPTSDGKTDLSHDIYHSGAYFDVDISLLIEGVVVAPYAADWFLQLVQSVAKTYGLDTPVYRSSLAETPIWS